MSNEPPQKKVKTASAERDEPDKKSSKGTNATVKTAQSPAAPAAASSFAAQMMASLQQLKQQSTDKIKQDDGAKPDSLNALSTKKKGKAGKKETYVPTDPAVLKTATSLGLHKPQNDKSSAAAKIQSIHRPQAVQAARMALPANSHGI